MKILKIVIIFGILLLIISAITRIKSVTFSTDTGIIFKPLDSQWGQIFNVIYSVGLSIWLYLIHGRKMSAWWIGTVLCFGAIINCLYLALSAAINQFGIQMLINLVGNIFFAILVYVFFAKWWLKKKTTYFKNIKRQ